MATIDYLAGRKTLKTVESPINGTLTVVRELGWGTYIKSGGIPQSGGLAKTIWEKSLKHAKRDKKDIKSVLVLGFAGGGIAQISRDLWPDCEIYGVDIDPLMIELGEKYLHWEKTNAKVWAQDAEEFIEDILTTGKPRGKLFSSSLPADYRLPATKFDLVCVDMYVGQSVPEKFSDIDFVKTVEKLISKNGIAVFNRLYGSSDTGQANKFGSTLKKVFKNTKAVYPAANVMFLCST